jgi:hypothetical protein
MMTDRMLDSAQATSRLLLPIWLLLAAGSCGGAMRAPPGQAPGEAPAPAAQESLEEDAEAPAAPQSAPPAPYGQEPSSLKGSGVDRPTSYQTLEEAEAALVDARQELERWAEQRERAQAKNAGREAAPTAAGPRGSDCALACRALASLDRAAQAICRLAGDSDQRCTRARQLLEDNRKRVARCGCEQ